MTTSRVQVYRSSVAGQRPPSGVPGSLYVNWADEQIGSIEPGGQPKDLLPVTFWSVDASYVAGNLVYNEDHIWRADATPTPGEFDYGEWSRLTGAAMRVGTTPPANPQSGDGWLDKSVTPAQVRIWDAGLNAYFTVSADKVPLTGGTMSGPLFLPTDQSADVRSATSRAYVDGEVSKRLTQTQADQRYFPFTGGTVTGLINAAGKIQVPGSGPIDKPAISFGDDTTGFHKFSTNSALRVKIANEIAAEFAQVGSSAPEPTTILTREKADGRFVRPSALDSYALKTYVDDKVSDRVPKSGGSMTGDLTVPKGGSSSTPNLRFGDSNAGLWVNDDQDVMNVRLLNANAAKFAPAGTDAPEDKTVMTREKADNRFMKSDTSSTTLDQLRDMLVANGIGARGEFVYARYASGNITYGMTVSGSSLQASGSRDGNNETSGPTLSGTWEARGEIATSDDSRATLWKRIA